MSERIEELKLQAIDFADATYKYELSEGFQIQEWDKIRLEKFAELIVRECMTVCADNASLAGGANTQVGEDLYLAVDLIKKHFGVEE